MPQCVLVKSRKQAVSKLIELTIRGAETKINMSKNKYVIL